MPNIKSAEKRVSVSNKKKLENQMVRSQMNTAIKKFNAAISSSDLELAKKLLPIAESKIDGAATKGVIHKNCANRKKSQVSKALYQLVNGIVVIKIDAKTQKQAEQKAAAVKKAEEQATIKATINDARKAKEAAKVPAPKKSAKPVASPVKKTEEKKETAKKAPKKVAKPVEQPVDEPTDEIK
ncbi:MAG: 30S ribosomal protein S20 [Clostridia bacterium]